jgi:hypothetical protein
MMSGTQQAGLQFPSLELVHLQDVRQAAVRGSVSENYGGSRTSQMLKTPAFLCIVFLQERRKEAKKTRKKEREEKEERKKNQLSSWWLPVLSTCTSRATKSQFKVWWL